MNASDAAVGDPGWWARPWLDLSFQLVGIASGLGPVLLVFYLLARNGERPSSIGVDATQPGRDPRRGAALAAVIGGAGLGLYYLAFKARPASLSTSSPPTCRTSGGGSRCCCCRRCRTACSRRSWSSGT